MKYVLLFFLLFVMGGTIIVKTPEKREFSHIKLDIGHALFCRMVFIHSMSLKVIVVWLFL